MATGMILVEARANLRQMQAQVANLDTLYARLALLRQTGVEHTAEDEDALNETQGEIVECRRRFRTAIAQLYALTGDEILSG